MARTGRWRALATQIGVWGTVALASAQPPPEATPLEDIALMLGSPSEDEVRQAIEAATISGDAEVVVLLEQRVREGLPPALLGAALDALSLLNHPSSAPLLRELAVHRDPAIRVRALRGLVALGAKRAEGAEAVLLHALGDPDASVRGAAAAGLGELGTPSATPALFTAYERGVTGSAEALGKLASPEHLDRVLGYLGAYPFENVAPLLLGLVARSDWKDVPKLRIVTQIQEVATAAAAEALLRITRMPADAVSRRIRRAAKAAAAPIENRQGS